jgi:amino acid transporter
MATFENSTDKKAKSSQPPHTWRTWLIGRPLATADAPHQTIGKLVGLAVFSSDALSSVAYGPQEILAVLVVAGMGALGYAFPIAIGIAILLAILTFSYEQTIHAYPSGGGAYIVVRDNLGELPAQIAGAALLTDYILTVAVSISSGVAQIVSALPDLYPFRVEIAVGMVMFIMLVNLRGVKESGAIFAVPTYFFLGMTLLTVLIGLGQYVTGNLGIVVDKPHVEIVIVQPLSLFLILRAFANGTASVTGVEAISDGIPAFKEPRSKNAGITLLWMSGILGTFLLTITFLAVHTGAVPSEAETVISQIARTVYAGRGPFYLAMITATTVILVMAANTAFADFPRLGAIAAKDGYLPRQLTFRGSRLVFSRGIATLAIGASLLIIIFGASVTGLIPLYAIGVFLSFTLSQSGMTRRWWKSGHLKQGEELKERGSVLHYDKGWVYKMIINAIGALTTFVVMIIFAVTKFLDGAWIIVVLLPVLVMGFLFIHRHYKDLARQLSLNEFYMQGPLNHNRVIIPISGVHRGTLAALRYARTLSDDITAVHVSIDPEEADKLKAKWELWGDGYRLVILESPYRLLIEPLVEYLDKIDAIRQPQEMITVVVPQFVPRQAWTNLLHTRTANVLRNELLFKDEFVIIEVPYQVE